MEIKWRNDAGLWSSDYLGILWNILNWCFSLTHLWFAPTVLYMNESSERVQTRPLAIEYARIYKALTKLCPCIDRGPGTEPNVMFPYTCKIKLIKLLTSRALDWCSVFERVCTAFYCHRNFTNDTLRHTGEGIHLDLISKKSGCKMPPLNFS